MDRLEAMAILVATVEAGSFSAASRKLSVPLPTVSRKLAALEEHLGVRLLVRSTRSLTLTEAGLTYLQSCKQIIDQVTEAERSVSGEYTTPRGELVVTAPVVFGRLHLLPIINDFLASFPKINIRLILSDKSMHLVDDHIDAALRVGKLPDSSMVATQVGTVCRVVCASPEYLASHGKPTHPNDLMEHTCVSFEGLPSGPMWSFTSAAMPTDLLTITVKPRLSVNTAEAAIDAAIASVGLTHILSYQIAHVVEQQRLRLVLREFEPTPIPVNLVHAGQIPLPVKTRSFFDFVVPRLRVALLGDKDRLRTGMSTPVPEYPGL
ncbi:LysR substrate-binding domain-containing protein [Pseudomonas reactans]|jgi:DNA-binding transcriptional LysR family regulator|uniref:LysR family transcriptional regulator n=3 Tax=Pseudomonas TaxID=286 RepID=A0ABX2R3R4_9PSED|nr:MULTISPECIES: LysR family transcriptional regulator [Pseudomonas]KGE65064.1 LysR family transcriptional regulator [Pseudomonas fluorescens LMG 5329]NWA46576.1 LysR family transcriptional regulator [Pseudomonas reactans]NWB31263.1 LysR family transcriptional regulator [Pseudomonas gingeri]NWC35151.1 LysR family transcriptional regulator [Pseudomonas gingeri]NWC54501.1 LysR family transcriptional regulator [Pseudomonas tolaasii]